jgi:5'-nucleotidase
VFVTNDDGIDSPGLWALAAAIASAGHDVVVGAPQLDMSGQSAGIFGLHGDRTLDVERREPQGAGIGVLDDAPCFAVGATPAMCVIGADLEAFGPRPDVVVSGINPGLNTGAAVLHSGTVGAALTAANFGLSALAVSLEFGETLHWETAASLAVPALDWLLAQPARTVLNLNAPNIPLVDVAGVAEGVLARFGSVRSRLVEIDDGRLQFEFVGGGDEHPEDTDAGLVARGWAALTVLNGVRAEPAASDVAGHVAGRLLRRSA